MRYSITTAVLLIVMSGSAFGGCGATVFTPLRLAGQPVPTPADHQALWLTDPSNQQYAVFDMEWGGTLARLVYDPAGAVLGEGNAVNPGATDLVWGHQPGAMVQPALFWGNELYNPEGAGDQEEDPTHPGFGAGRGSPALGGACQGGTTLKIYAGTTDWFGLGYWARAATIKNGGVIANMWSTPYTTSTVVTWEPTGLAAPKPQYYLRLNQYITNIDTTEELGFNTGFSLYVPIELAHQKAFPAACLGDPPVSTCLAGATPRLIDGHYSDDTGVGGVALLLEARTYFPSSTNVYVHPTGVDLFWNEAGSGLGGLRNHTPGTAHHWVIYVMAGDWTDVTEFRKAQNQIARTAR